MQNQEKLTYAIRSQETGYPCGGDNKQAVRGFQGCFLNQAVRMCSHLGKCYQVAPFCTFQYVSSISILKKNEILSEPSKIAC